MPEFVNFNKKCTKEVSKMDNKSRFLLGQEIWCILDLSDGLFSEGIIDSECKMSEYGRSFYKIDLKNDTFVNVFSHNIFETKQKLLDYVNDLVYGS